MDQGRVETTSYSLYPAAPTAADRRSGERHVTLLRVGTLIVANRRELCLVRNISAGGLMLKIYSPLLVGQPVAVELKNGTALAGTISWLDGQQAGLAFDQPVDVADILAEDSDRPLPRMPRMETRVRALVRDGAARHPALCCDISQGGLKLALETPLAPDCEVVVTLPGFDPLPAVVRWWDDGHAGLSFNRLLPLPVLIAWLQDQRRDEAAA